MVTLNRIYTRTGDDGLTGLATGERISKDHPRVTAYGDVDEANAAIGIARAALDDSAVDDILGRLQQDLFDAGADLATPGPDDQLKFTPLRIVDEQIVRLEQEIDLLNADLAPLKSFVLPAGTEASARLHLARTIMRRAERHAVTLLQSEPDRVNVLAIRFLNRASDLLFVAARHVNAKAAGDVLWVPGSNRTPIS
jgi:cob(I)alamin adenosyltransferase